MEEIDLKYRPIKQWCLIKGYIVWLFQTNTSNDLVALLSLDKWYYIGINWYMI